jgi:hypothetical protein
VRSHTYDDPLDPARRPSVQPPRDEPAVLGLVVEHVSGWVGAVTETVAGEVELEDRAGRRRVFPIEDPGFRVDGVKVRLVRPAWAAPAAPTRTASGSVAVADVRARVARGGRIWVEGVHDAALVERVWGDDLRIEGVVVEPLDGVDELVSAVASFAPTPARRLGVLVDHLVPGSKETRIVAGVRHASVLVLGHPYVDVWQAVKPASLGISAWPSVPRDEEWKAGVCARLGWGTPREGWRRVLGAVDSFADLEVPLLRAVEELIDFVTA